MPAAAERTDSRSRASLTPPALPRPPACTCALITQTEPPSARAASTASAALAATRPCGTGMPYVRNNSFAWYSCRFMLGRVSWVRSSLFCQTSPGSCSRLRPDVQQLCRHTSPLSAFRPERPRLAGNRARERVSADHPAGTPASAVVHRSRLLAARLEPEPADDDMHRLFPGGAAPAPHAPRAMAEPAHASPRQCRGRHGRPLARALRERRRL